MSMSMDHMSMDMSGTATTTAGMASSTGGADMSSMHSMDSMGGCKISMMWNWYTVDSCFIAKSWHVTSKGMFAGSCIGVILLVLSLEFLRRAGKEYDRYIIAQYKDSLAASAVSTPRELPKGATASAIPASYARPAPRFRPSAVQQAIRALLHMLQFAVAYFVMLLAMYYNGYIIICIFIGAFLGYFTFGWESFNVGLGGSDRLEEEVTVCCG